VARRGRRSRFAAAVLLSGAHPAFNVRNARRSLRQLWWVKGTLAASMPAPVAMYRAGGFDVAEQPIDVPTLVINGADDGCARPFLCDGQDRLFTSAYRAETWPRTGHFPHLEHPGRTAESVLAWLTPHLTTAH